MFDLLLCTKILLYSNITDWPIIKPYLISSNFYTAFHSLEFSKSYLINLFQLNENEIKQLQNCIFVYNNKIEEPERKKIKSIYYRDKEKFNYNILNLTDALKIYVKFYNTMNNRMKITQQLINDYNNEKSLEIITQIKKLIKIEKANNKLIKEINEYIDKDDNKTLFGNLKGIFIHSIKKQKTNFFIEFTIFTNCGFPLKIFIVFKEEIDLYRGISYLYKTIKINSETLLQLNYSYNEEGYSNFKEEYSESVLNNLKTALLNCANSVVEYSAEELNLIIYNWLEIGLFEFSFSFMEADKFSVFGKILQ